VDCSRLCENSGENPALAQSFKKIFGSERVKDVDELQRRIDEEWDKLKQRIIDKAVGEW